MMTNRPWAKRSRWVTAIAVCASAVGLAALLGAAMTPPAARPGRKRRAGAHGARELCRPPRQRHRRARTLSPRAARRSTFEPDPRPLSRRHRRRQKLFLRQRHRRIREVSLRARRRHQVGRRRTCVRHFPALSAAQPRAHELRRSNCSRRSRISTSTSPSISIARRSRGRRTPPR